MQDNPEYLYRAVNDAELESIVELNGLSSKEEVQLNRNYRMRIEPHGKWDNPALISEAMNEYCGRYLVRYQTDRNTIVENVTSDIFELVEPQEIDVRILAKPKEPFS